MENNVTGSGNTAIGAQTLLTNKIGNNNTALGANADVTDTNLTNATAVGYNAQVNASNKVVVGNTSVTSIGGQVGWSTYSDIRLKENVQESKLGLNFILKLKPVTYSYKAEGQQNRIYTGLIANDVEKAAKDLKVDFSGVDKPGSERDFYSLRYAEFVMPLINAAKELHSQATVMQQQIDSLKAELQELKNDPRQSSTKIVELSSAQTASLDQNEPNPFTEQTTISYIIPADVKEARLVFYDAAGKMINKVELPERGSGKIVIQASGLNGGTYTYCIVADGKVIDTRTMVKLD